VLQAAQDAGVFVIEDDWVRDLDLESDSPSLPPLCTDDQHGHVLYIRSFSKVTAPGLRVGAIVCRGPVAARLRRARMFTDFFVPPLLQAVLVEVLQSPDYRRHLEHLRLELRTRRDAFLDVIDSRDGGSHGIQCVRPAGGVAVWLSLKERTNEAAFVDACAARGVRVSAGAPFWTSEPQGAHIRVSFASAPAKDLALAAQRIIDVSQTL
jgi:DNA-binding transcriptional MocR family regulator